MPIENEIGATMPAGNATTCSVSSPCTACCTAAALEQTLCVFDNDAGLLEALYQDVYLEWSVSRVLTVMSICVEPFMVFLLSKVRVVPGSVNNSPLSHDATPKPLHVPPLNLQGVD